MKQNSSAGIVRKRNPRKKKLEMSERYKDKGTEKCVCAWCQHPTAITVSHYLQMQQSEIKLCAWNKALRIKGVYWNKLPGQGFFWQTQSVPERWTLAAFLTPFDRWRFNVSSPKKKSGPEQFSKGRCHQEDEVVRCNVSCRQEERTNRTTEKKELTRHHWVRIKKRFL